MLEFRLEEMRNWWRLPKTREHYLALANHHRRQLLPPFQGEGRGIVTCAGGVKYLPSLYVMLNVLRHVHDCTLPVEVWHLGELEVDPFWRRLLESLDVEWRDARELAKDHPCRILNGWELKCYAVVHSHFRQVLFLDADCVPTRDPAKFFDWPAYQENKAVFFPDLPEVATSSRFLDPESAAVYGVKLKPIPLPSGREAWCGKKIEGRWLNRVNWETGQFLVDRKLCWAGLQMALHFAENSDYYFNWGHGDCRCFSMGFRTTNTPYALASFWPSWDVTTIEQRDFDGDVAFEHRTQDKWQLKGNRHGTRTLMGPHCNFIIAQLARAWRGRLWYNDAPTETEIHLMKGLEGRWEYHREGDDEPRVLELLPGGKIGQGAAEMEVAWSSWEHGGKQALTLHGRKGLTAMVVPHKVDEWAGRWVVKEGMECSLVRCPDEPVKGITADEIFAACKEPLITETYPEEEAVPVPLFTNPVRWGKELGSC